MKFNELINEEYSSYGGWYNPRMNISFPVSFQDHILGITEWYQDNGMPDEIEKYLTAEGDPDEVENAIAPDTYAFIDNWIRVVVTKEEINMSGNKSTFKYYWNRVRKEILDIIYGTTISKIYIDFNEGDNIWFDLSYEKNKFLRYTIS